MALKELRKMSQILKVYCNADQRLEAAKRAAIGLPNQTVKYKLLFIF